MNVILKMGLMLGLAASSIPVEAATVIFSGSRTNVDAPGPAAARCGMRATTNVVNNPPSATASGLSNFGAFTPTMSHCIDLPLSMVGLTIFDLGEFVFEFTSGDTLFGSYSGSLAPSSPGIFSVTQTHTVTGGSGFFAGAVGSFNSAGTLSFLLGKPTVNQTFEGELTVAAVPEPKTWMMLLVGYMMIGFALRSGRRRQTKPISFA